MIVNKKELICILGIIFFILIFSHSVASASNPNQNKHPIFQLKHNGELLVIK